MKRAKRACRFATLSLKREIMPGDVGTDDSDSDEEEENDFVQALRLEGGERGGMIYLTRNNLFSVALCYP